MMRTHIRAMLALCAALLALSSIGQGVALGQLTPVGAPVVEFSSGPTTISQPAGGEFELSVVGDVYTLAGDMHARLPVDVVPSPFSVYVFGTQRVSVGPLPVQITPTASSNYKLVNGGGPVSSTFPATTVHTALAVLEASETRKFPIFQNEGIDHTQSGNGFTIVNEVHPTSPSYVLGAGLTYDLSLFYQIDVDLTGAPEAYPTIVITLEAGGISGWSGLSADFNAITVPEPGLGLLSVAAMITLSGVRRPRRR